MIKCIASDLDGTLLPPSGILPKEIFPLIDEMCSRGIIFVAASGRQLPSIKAMFAQVLDKIAIIAENGGLCFFKGETIYCRPTRTEDVLYALSIIKKEKGIYPLCSGTDCAFYDSDDAQFVRALRRSYLSAEHTDDLERAVRENTILKISVWDSLSAQEHAAKLLIPKIKGLRVKVSGRDWLDVCETGVNKGSALSFLLTRLKMKKSECVAFGDHMNDYEMLLASGQAFVTANAFPALKELVQSVIPSNAENGVMRTIEKLLSDARDV